MEEILASIRRIISEDDQSPEPVAVAHTPASPPPAPEPVHHEDEDVLELNEPAPTPRETHGDLDVFDTHAPVAQPVPEPAPSYTASFHEEEPVSGGLVSDHAASAAASHFGALAQTIAMPAAGRTLEDLVREMMRPMLKDWLDQHLSPMVEQAVRDEVERISRRRV